MEISNNKRSIQLILKAREKNMYFLPPPLFAPHLFLYLYTQPPVLQNVEEKDSRSVQEISSNSAISLEEKIMLTREDLEKEGYEQTKRPWTAQEDKRLLRLCKDENARFEQIAVQMKDRNAKMCYSRYRRLSHLSKIGWTKPQNQRLVSLVELHGEDWKIIADLFKEKTLKQLKEHYLNYLKPELIKSQWTLQEDLELIRLINKYGKDWKQVEDEFKGRSRSQIKNRFFGKISRMNKRKAQGRNS